MPAQVGDDDAEPAGIAGGEDQLPVGADAGAAVEQQQRVPVAAILVVQLKSVDVDVSACAAKVRPSMQAWQFQPRDFDRDVAVFDFFSPRPPHITR